MNMEHTIGSTLWQSSRGGGKGTPFGLPEREPRKPSRIVVDINQDEAIMGGASRAKKVRQGDYLPPGGVGSGGKKRRGCFARLLGGALLVTLVLLLVAGVGGYLWWRSVQASPTYSLALLADAAQKNDARTFDELLDASRVTRSFLPQIRRHATGSTRDLPPAIERQVGAAVEQQLPNIEATVRESLRASVADLTRAAGAEAPFPLLVLALRGLATDVREEGQTAIVNLNLGGEQPTALTMERRANRWQVVGVQDARIAATLAAQLPNALPKDAPPQQQQPQGALERELQRRTTRAGQR